MNKSVFLLGLFFLLFIPSLFAQPSVGQKLGKWDSQIYLQDVSGRPMSAKYLGVDGFPYVINKFTFGDIELKNARKFSKVLLKLDIVAQEILFLTPDKEEGVIGSDFVKEVAFSDTTEGVINHYLFRAGLPAIENYKSNQFCLVLTEGKITLLKSMAKNIETRKNELSGEIVKEFALSENFYILQNGIMNRFKRSKENILTLMYDKAPQIEIYLKENKGNFKNQQYLRQIFNYYNNL